MAQFTEEEAQRIFARAAARQHAHDSLPEGLTLNELQEIGRSAGLDPEHVAAAATETLIEAKGETTWHGVPTTILRTRLLPSRVSDSEWETIVDLLRDHYGTPGTAQQIGRRREWTPTSGSEATPRVTIAPQENGDLLRIQAPDILRPLAVGLSTSLVGAAVVLTVLIGTITDDIGGALLMGGGLVAVAVILYLGVFAAAQTRARKTPARLDALLDRIDLASRQDDRLEPVNTPTVLDLDGLDDAPNVSSNATRSRTRA